MISAVIEASTGKLAPTLAALVPAAVDGFVREVIVADGTGSPEIRELVEDAGAQLAAEGTDSFAAACRGARQGWLLLLCAGARLEAGWSEAAWRHITDHADRAGWFELSLRGRWPAAPVSETSAAVAAWFGRLQAAHGLLLPRPLLDAAVRRGARVGLPLRLRRSELAPIKARVLAEV